MEKARFMWNIPSLNLPDHLNKEGDKTSFPDDPEGYQRPLCKSADTPLSALPPKEEKQG